MKTPDSLFITILLGLLLGTLDPAGGYSQRRVINLSKDLQLLRISPDAWIHVSWTESQQFGKFSSNGLIYTNQGKAFLFDTPVTEELTKKLIRGLKDSLGVQVTGFVPNHSHDDCMGGLAYLKTLGIKSWASQSTVDIARQQGLPLPDEGFKDSLILQLNNHPVGCYYFGAAHSPDNIVVWIPSEKILFAGCMCKSMQADDLGNTADSDLYQWIATIGKVIDRFPGADIVIPGHGAYGGKEQLHHTLALLYRDTPRVTGIGGIFFLSKDVWKTKEWYRQNLGLAMGEYGSAFEFRNAHRPDEINYLEWSPFSEKTSYFKPSEKDFMINYRVQHLELLVGKLRQNGVTIVDSLEKYDYGKFIHIMDPEGNKIELWEPVDHVLTGIGGPTTK